MTEINIEAGQGESQYWRDLWRYRELLGFLAWRDVAVRYKQTVFGVAWALFRPLATLAIFTVVFGRLAKLPSDGVPYILFVMAGLLPWTLISGGLAEASQSLVGNANMISKVYFPRLLMPLSSLAAPIVDFAVSLAFLAGLACYYHTPPSLNLAWLPLAFLLALALSAGAGAWLAALNVRYRDFRYVLPFITQLGLYASPVGFSTALVPERWLWLYRLNPAVGVIDFFRYSLFAPAGAPLPASLPAALLLTAALLWSGIAYFRSTERTFADVI
jgi:lipopolysaccharide transport system permease protein